MRTIGLEIEVDFSIAEGEEARLHEAAEAEDGILESALLDELPGADLDLFQHLQVLFCAVHAKGVVQLDAHGRDLQHQVFPDVQKYNHVSLQPMSSKLHPESFYVCVLYIYQ